MQVQIGVVGRKSSCRARAFDSERLPRCSNRAWGILILAGVLAGLAGPAPAQEPGVYKAKVKVSGVQAESENATRRVTYAAEIEIGIPVTRRRSSSALFEVNDVAEPSAAVTVTQWSLEERNATPDSDGKITSWRCELASPAELHMFASGSLDLNYTRGTYSMYVSLVPTEEVKLNCENSRTGPYKQLEALGFFFGTHNPSAAEHRELPFQDAAHIKGGYTLMPEELGGQYLWQEQEWELVLGQ